MIQVDAIGWKAHAALARTGGQARLLAALTESIYVEAAGEVLWLGRTGSSMHPRAVLMPPPLPSPSDLFTLDVATLRPWRVTHGAAASPAVVIAARTLLAELRRAAGSHPPLGLGRLLLGASPGFPLDGAVAHARALALACAVDDPEHAMAAAVPLLGLGPGLTPSGDDLVGGVFFVRRALGGDGDAWARAAAVLLANARERTHPISVALLSDLIAGDGHEPLHDLWASLASTAERAGAVEAAYRLGRLGHSSGWDILTGVLAAVLGPEALTPVSAPDRG